MWKARYVRMHHRKVKTESHHFSGLLSLTCELNDCNYVQNQICIVCIVASEVVFGISLGLGLGLAANAAGKLSKIDTGTINK